MHRDLHANDKYNGHRSVTALLSGMGTNVVFNDDGGGQRKFKGFPYSDLVTSVFSYFHWTLCTPFKIKFETESGLYRYQESGWSYKIAAICWQSIHAIYIAWGCILFPVYESTFSYTKYALHRLTYVFYGFYQVIWLMLMWNWLREVPSLLNQGNVIYQSTLIKNQLPNNGNHQQQFSKLWQRKRCRRASVFMFLAFLSISCALVFALNIFTATSWLEGGPVDFADIEFGSFVNMTISSFCKVGNVWCVILENEQYHGVAYGVTLIWVGIIILSEIFWHVTFYMLTFWALYFKKLVARIVRKIKMAESSDQLFSAIKLLAKVSLLVEEFNGIFGIFVLVAALDTILYKTICFSDLFSGDYAPAEVAYLILSTVPSFIMLYSMADVHKLGSTVPNILKRKYLVEDNWMEESQLQSLDGVHMSLFSQNDALSNIIGFKGSGFFTISFAFVGSLIGITITYTVVLIQFSSNSTRIL